MLSLIERPTVAIVGRQVADYSAIEGFLRANGVAWESDSGNPAEILTETAGRICYMSFANPRPGGNHAYLDHIKESAHGSVFEHSVWNIIVEGVSRSLSHELVRHRAGWGYSQLSQRYVPEDKTGYVIPPMLMQFKEAYLICRNIARLEAVDSTQKEMRDQVLAEWTAEAETKFGTIEEARQQAAIIAVWMKAIETAQEAYTDLANRLQPYVKGTTKTEILKETRQTARSVLPNATETKLFMTVNGRALRHFFEQRGSRFAEPEIRRLAGVIHEAVVKESPNLFGDYTRTELPDGSIELDTQWRKV